MKMVKDVKNLCKNNENIGEYMVVWNVEDEKYFKTDNLESTLNDYINNVYSESNDEDIISFSSNGLEYEVTDIIVDDKLKEVNILTKQYLNLKKY